MRILVAHNRYQFSGGEDAVVRDEVELLRYYGHTVELLEQDNDAIIGIQGKLIASASSFYSDSSRRKMKKMIRDFRPDIVHVHNWFPMLSPSIIMEANASGVPTIQTLHNFRMLCANGHLFRAGSICTDCIGRSLPPDGVVHGCYRGSRAGSAVVTMAFAFHRLVHTWDAVDIFVAVSDFQREILVRGGLPAEKILVKPNFVWSDAEKTDMKKEQFALFVGRLSPEKGIGTLLSAWNSGKIPLRLKIIGDGPMAEEARTCAASNTGVEYLGFQGTDEVYRAMAKARFLVFPSEWYEALSRTVIEAFSRGTPVLAASLGAVQELVEEGETGYLFLPGDVGALIAGALRFHAGEEYESMRSNCLELFERKFTAEINNTLLIEIYTRAIAARRLRQQNPDRC